MEYNSFYGGRQGTPFIIAAQYETMQQMITAFSQGDEYRTVAYNEYVIIAATNRNDPDNGKVYRRVKTDPGYEYIGQIVGPAGAAPSVSMDTYNTVAAMTGSQTNSMTIGNEDLIPGKSGNTYNDTIQYAYCSVRNADGSQTTVYFGFKIPYTVIDYTAASVDPYYHRDEELINQNLVDRVDHGEHPYYEKWDIKIPKGIKGDTFKNFRKIIPNSNVSYNDPGGQTHTLYKDKSYLVYDYYNYELDPDPEPITYYLGDYNMIDSITEQDGTVTINYTNDNSQDLMTIKYITSIAITVSTGKMVVTYNTKTNGNYDTETFSLTYVYSAALAQDGTFSYRRTNGNGTINVNQEDKLTWIANAQVLNTGEFQTKKNTSETWDTLTILKYITGVEGVGGYLKINYNTGEPSTYIWQGVSNSTGAIVAEESAEPDPVFAEGSPWFVVEEILPYKRRLNYIQSTGGQYIDLNTDINNSLFEAQIKIQLTDSSNACNIFGANASGQKKTFYIINEYESSHNYWRYSHYIPGYGYGFYINNANPAELYTLKVGIRSDDSANTYQYFHEYEGGSGQFVRKDSLAEIDTLYLLNIKNKTGNYAPAKLYSFKLYKNNILTMDLIPVIDKNDIPCLYDEISGEFFYNAGIGQFSYGEVE